MFGNVTYLRKPRTYSVGSPPAPGSSRRWLAVPPLAMRPPTLRVLEAPCGAGRGGHAPVAPPVRAGSRCGSAKS